MKTQTNSGQGSGYKFRNKTEREKRYVKPERHIKRIDFQRVEEAPLNKFEKKIQEKMAVSPSPADLLIRQERRATLLEAVEKANLSKMDHRCVELTLEGLRPIEIARNLRISNGAVHNHLKRAKVKIRNVLETCHFSIRE